MSLVASSISPSSPSSFSFGPASCQWNMVARTKCLNSSCFQFLLFFPFSDFSSPLSLTRLTSLLGLRRAMGRGVQKSTGEKYDMKFPSGLNELHEAEFYMNCSSQPSMVHWLSSSNFPCSPVWLFSHYGDIPLNLRIFDIYGHKSPTLTQCHFVPNITMSYWPCTTKCWTVPPCTDQYQYISI